MVLAVLGGFVFLFLFGASLVLTAIGRSSGEPGGSAFAVSGGLSRRLFTRILIVVLATLVAAAIGLWRRSKPGRG
jgi:uncharacterized membrane protein